MSAWLVWLVMSVGVAHASSLTPQLVRTPHGVRWTGARLDGATRGPAPVAAWRDGLRDTSFVGLAVRPVLADTLAAHGDTLGADAILADPRLLGSIWAADAVLRRAGYRAARADTVGAVKQLDSLDDHRPWRPEELSAVTARRASYRLSLGDTVAAESLAAAAIDQSFRDRDGIREPVEVLERITQAHGAPFSNQTRRALAMAALALARPESAVDRIRDLASREPMVFRSGDLRWALQVSLEEGLYRTALALCDTIAAESGHEDWLDPARARAYRGLGLWDSAQRVQAGWSSLGNSAQASVATFRAAIDARNRGLWREAARWFDVSDSLSRLFKDGPDQVGCSREQAGLMYRMAGDVKRAYERWGRDRWSELWIPDELRRREPRTAPDSILRNERARLSGYWFGAVEAREKLGLTGWPGTIMVPGSGGPDSAGVSAIRRLGGPLALPAEATRWVRELEFRTQSSSLRVGASSWAAIAASAYANGDMTTGSRIAQYFSSDSDSTRWAVEPWVYPPAFETEVRAAARAERIEPALLWAVMFEGSRFNPRVITMNRRFGLMQLGLPDARAAAASLHETLPGDTLLLDPTRSIRFAARRMRMLLDRFDGETVVMLRAYLFGEDSVRPDWRRLIDRVGEGLFVELTTDPGQIDRVKDILAARQAYRELRPTSR